MHNEVCKYKSFDFFWHKLGVKRMSEKFTMSLPNTMNEALKAEMKDRKLDTMQETIRSILSEYFKNKNTRVP
jgi:hypothetical protein